MNNRNGLSIDVNNMSVSRGKKQTVKSISLHINGGEFIAICGKCGSGKSTTASSMSGRLPPSMGSVLVNGLNLYQNLDMLKDKIAYLEQKDVQYGNLSVYESLFYTSCLRLPCDMSRVEIDRVIYDTLLSVGLENKVDSLVRNLSGGERRRVAIASELLADTPIIFLDEPASGLDPATELNLMKLLRCIADSGKTVIVITHSTLYLDMCDRIAFMAGGKLCFYGPFDEALRFFKEDNISHIFEKVDNNPLQWSSKFDKYRIMERPSHIHQLQKPHETRWQPPILFLRSMALLFGDYKKLLLILLQPPLLAFLLYKVADSNVYKEYEITRALMFVFSICGFWIGIVNTILEISSEKKIFRREYMAGLSIDSYLISKLFFYSLICVVQSLLLVGVFRFLVGLPERGVVINPMEEFYITTFLTIMASSCLGLFVSAIMKTSSKALLMVPILVLPQILFSGMLFDLEGISNKLSVLIIGKASISAYGTLCDLNALPLKLQIEGMPIAHTPEDCYNFLSENIFSAWASLLIFIIIPESVRLIA